MAYLTTTDYCGFIASAIQPDRGEIDKYFKSLYREHEQDNKEDFFLGGSAGISGRLFIQNQEGTFDEIQQNEKKHLKNNQHHQWISCIPNGRTT